MTGSAVARFVWELHSRRVFRTVGLYVIGSWAVLQAADILFPGWGIPDAAIRYLFLAMLAGLPVVIAFAWVFDISTTGIRRAKQSAEHALRRTDYLVLAAFVAVMGFIAHDAVTRVLLVAVTEGASPSAPEPGVRAQSIAVLPFTNLSADTAQEHFADGISEEILNHLALFPELSVIARTSSFSFKDSGYDIPRISRLLGVEYLLQGSIRRDAERIRIAAQLIDRDGVQLWTRTFDREFGGVFALYDEIAEAVATSIAPTIAPPASDNRIPDFEAYESYLTGRTMIASREPYHAYRALPYLDRAIELDPSYVDALAERAVAHGFLVSARQDPATHLELAQRDLDRAMALRPDHPRTLTARAFVLGVADSSDSLGAREALLRRSLMLDPNQVDAWNWLSGVLRGLGREEESERALNRAVLLDPLAPSPNVNLINREIARGDYEAAERRLQRLLGAPRVADFVLPALFQMRVFAGRFDEAIDVWQQYMLVQPTELTGMLFTTTILGLDDDAAHWRHQANRVAQDDSLLRLLVASIASANPAGAPGAYDEARSAWRSAVHDDSFMGDVTRTLFGSVASAYDDHVTAIEVLEPLLRHTGADAVRFRRARHALAWSYRQAGELAKSQAALEPLLQHDRAATDPPLATEWLDPLIGYWSGGYAGRALTLQLAGDAEAALDLLELAVDAGWRGERMLRTDPRWASLLPHPRMQAVLTRLATMLDEQRARVVARDPDGAIRARIDAALEQLAP